MIFHKKKLVYHDEPAMMTNMPETSNSELTDTNILINVILIVRLHIFPSQIKEDRDVEKNVCSESMLRNLQICRTAAYLNLISTTTSSAHACIE